MFLPEIDTAMAILFATVLVAGMVRGFAGFGTGMIIVPVAAALYGPVAALVIVFIIDSLPAIPVTVPVIRIARWVEVVPVLAGLAVFLPAGIWILKTGDPLVLRWVICVLVLAAVAVLASGWRHRGAQGRLVSFGVGSVAGLTSGIASMPGPPVILYWMGSPEPARIVRANILVFLLCSEVFFGLNLWAAQLFSLDTVMRGVVSAPVYLIGTLAGLWMFKRAPEAVYRKTAFVLIVAVALAALPVFDGFFGH